MDKSIFKVFFSKDKEVKWLNKLGQEGYLLVYVSDSKYKFVINEGEKYFYSIEYLDCSPRSEKATEYFKSRESLEISPIIASGNWVYFVSKRQEIENTVEILKKNSIVYFWRSIYFLFFAICGSVFCGYHIYASDLLRVLEQPGQGKIELLSTNGVNAILKILKGGLNYIIKAINKYIGLWTESFGKNDSVAIVAIIVPIVIVLILIATFNIDSYICFLNARRKLKKQMKDNVYTEKFEQSVISEDLKNAE